MAGIRERKKRERQKRICDAALELFHTQGFNKTTMDEVATKADLAVGTLYNYYPSKGDLLLAVMSAQLEIVITNTPPFPPEIEANPPAAINAYLQHYLTFFTAHNKEVWLEMFKAMLSNPAHLQQGIGLDMQLITKLTQLIQGFQEKGLISKSINSEQAAMLVYSFMVMAFIGSLVLPEAEGNQFLAMIQPNITLLYNGLKE